MLFDDFKAVYKLDKEYVMFHSVKEDGGFFSFKSERPTQAFNKKLQKSYTAEEVFCDDNWIKLPYIGEKDKNGNKIYLGDVLMTDEAGWIGKVVFGGGIFYLTDNRGGYSSYVFWSECENLGSHYTNPKLESLL